MHMHAPPTPPPPFEKTNKGKKTHLLQCAPPLGGGGLTHAKQLGPHHEYPQNFFFEKFFQQHWHPCSLLLFLSVGRCAASRSRSPPDISSSPLLLLSFFKSVASTPFGRKGAGEERVAAMQLPVWVSGKKKGRESENLLLFLPARVCIVQGGGRRGAKDSVSPLLSANGQRCIEMPPNEPKEEKGDFLFC